MGVVPETGRTKKDEQELVLGVNSIRHFSTNGYTMKRTPNLRAHCSGTPNQRTPRSVNPTNFWSSSTLAASGSSSSNRSAPGSSTSRSSWLDDNMQASDVVEVVPGDQASPWSSDDEQRSEVYLSVCWTTGKLGAAFYDAKTCQIQLLGDTVDSPPDFFALNTLIKMAVPQTIIVSLRHDERFVTALRQAVGELESPADSMTSVSDGKDNILAFVNNVLFDLAASKSLIVNHLSFPSMPQFLTSSDRAIYLSSLIDFNNISTVRSLGALLKFLDRKRVNVELEQLDVKSPIISLSMFSLQDLMLMDDHTYNALQIFQKEWHPSVYKLASGTKEGLSLFGIFNRCKSFSGSKEMMLMFLRPTKNAAVLSQRHAAISYFLYPGNSEIVSALQSFLRLVKNVSCILGKMKGGQVSIADWVSLYKTAFNALLIYDVCKLQPHSIDIFSKITKSFTTDLMDIVNHVDRTIDFDESASQSRFVVKWGVDEMLDEKKRRYNGLPDLLTMVARNELDRLDLDVSQCSVVYLPQIGYLLAIPMSDEWKLTGNYVLENLEYVFISNDVVYFKSDSTKALDLEIGDIQNTIIDQETSIQLSLQSVVMSKSAVLVDVLKYCSQLDCLLALANVANEFNYIQPVMTDDDQIIINDGRHPLQELCVASLIPNSTVSGGTYGKVKLLTGPNASGKSVYLKQVALIAYMAHIGSFVPASSAHICFLDGIFSRVRTIESVSSGMSTFMLDLNQMSMASRMATTKSLVIVDEFGKGSSAADGMALLAASINYFLDKGENSPHLLVTTHIYGVIHHLPERHPQLTYQTMETVDDKGELVYLFRLVEGKASKSFAAQCAHLAGIPAAVIERGIQVTNCLSDAQPIPMDSSKLDSHFEKRHDEVMEFLSLDQDSIESIRKFFRKLAFENDHLDESLVPDEYPLPNLTTNLPNNTT